MTTWHKRDWEQYYEMARRPWRRHRPPRPVYPTGINRVLPAQGFSLSELDDAGVDLDLAERLGLPVDAGRIGAYGPNVTVLRDFIRSSRRPLRWGGRFRRSSKATLLMRARRMKDRVHDCSVESIQFIL